MAEPFYELSEEQRLSLVESAIGERRSLVERWEALAPPESDPWTARARIAAGMLVGHAAVADVGCGNMQLERFLPSGCRYIPIDLVARDERTIVVDLNSDRLPIDLRTSCYAMLGLLEYIYDVPQLLSQISGTLVVSYNPLDLSARNRKAHGWLNGFTIAEFEALTGELGWSSSERVQLGAQMIWKLARA